MCDIMEIEACYETFFDEKFLDNVTHILALMKLIILMPRNVNDPFPCIGKIYNSM